MPHNTGSLGQPPPTRTCEQSHCGASVGNTEIKDLVYADDAVIFAESLHEETKPLGHKVSWFKTKAQVFGGVLDETVQSVHVCGEDIEISENSPTLVV